VLGLRGSGEVAGELLGTGGRDCNQRGDRESERGHRFLQSQALQPPEHPQSLGLSLRTYG
jgi:hypothetical protein